MFIAIGLLLFSLGIFFIGKQRNLFNPTFKLKANFYNVSGLLVGNNIRFSGVNVGTVDNMQIINDTTVLVEMIIRKEIQKFIKLDSKVSIGSEGLIGDRLLVISQGSNQSKAINENHLLESIEPTETDAIMESLEITAQNAEIITNELAEIMFKVNNGNGTLARLLQDSSIADNFNQTMLNLRRSSKGLDENMNAVKHNFLLRGYFKRKALKNNK